MLKNAKKIYEIGQWFMVAGSAVYLAELLTREQYNFTLPIYILYGISVILIAIGWIGTRDERREEKAKLSAEKKA